MKRRGFFGMIAGAVAAGPSAAKSVAKQAGINLSPVAFGEIIPMKSLSDNCVPNSVGASIGKSWTETRLLRFNLLKSLRPAFFEKRHRDNARHVNRFDLDLSSLQSMSLAAKVAVQRERNYRRLIAEEEGYLNSSWEEEQFEKLHGMFR